MAEKEVFEFDLVVSRARRFGMIFMVLEQLAQYVSDAVATSCRLFLVFGTHGDQVYWTSRLLGLDQEQGKRLPSLPRGTCVALLTGDRCPRPFVMEIPRYHHEVIGVSRAEVRELASRSLAGLREGVAPRWMGFQARLQGEQQEKDDAEEIRGVPRKVMTDICLHPMSLIGERTARLRIDRNADWRARDILRRRALVEEKKVLGNHTIVVPTAKGIAWARRHGVRVHSYKSGDDHEFALSRLCHDLLSLSSQLAIRRAGTQINGVEADALLTSRAGLCVPIQVSDANDPMYEADRLVFLANVPDVDLVLFVGLRKKSCDTVWKLLLETDSGTVLRKVVVLHVATVLSPNFDWTEVLSRTGWTLSA